MKVREAYTCTDIIQARKRRRWLIYLFAKISFHLLEFLQPTVTFEDTEIRQNYIIVAVATCNNISNNPLKLRPHQQHVEATFDFVANNGNNVERVFLMKFRSIDKIETNWTWSVCFHFVERMKFRSTLLPKRATMSKQYSTLSKESFDLWHSTMLLRHCCWCGRGFMLIGIRHKGYNCSTIIRPNLLCAWHGFSAGGRIQTVRFKFSWK